MRPRRRRELIAEEPVLGELIADSPRVQLAGAVYACGALSRGRAARRLHENSGPESSAARAEFYTRLGRATRLIHRNDVRRRHCTRAGMPLNLVAAVGFMALRSEAIVMDKATDVVLMCCRPTIPLALIILTSV